MPLVQPTSRLGLLLCCWALLSTGCAQLATVRCWTPPDTNLSGMERVTVADFQGERGAEVAAEVSQRLSRQAGLLVVDQNELTGVHHAACVSAPSESSLIARARECGIDGLIVGEVLEYRCDDDLLKDQASPQQQTSLVAATPAEAPSKSRVLQRGELQREAGVAVSFRLIDVQTGKVIVARETRHQFRRTSDSSRETFPAKGIVLHDLTGQCIDEFLESLAPHQEECEMQLARGGWYGRTATDIRAGNRLAMQGNWDGARDRWQQAVDRDAASDAALYNLAIDAAHRQQYHQAEELAMQAIRLRHTNEYAAGLERFRHYRSGQEAAMSKRDRMILQASATLP